MANNKRILAEKRGRRAETIAALWLRLKGYRLLARRFKTPVGEIDLIVKRGRVIAFVEVKAQQTRRDALEAVSPQARNRIGRAAEWYLARMAAETHKNAEITRFDMVLVVPGQRPHHMPDAWREGMG